MIFLIFYHLAVTGQNIERKKKEKKTEIEAFTWSSL